MTSNHQIILSAENNPYAAWQAKLFYFSCVTRLKHSPTIIVHETGERWQPGFYDLVRFGATVRSAPSYSVTAYGDHYFPRNTAGTLLHAAEMYGEKDQFLVICDPDMIFVRRPSFLESLSADYYSYMNYDQEAVETASQKIGVTRDMINAQKEELRGGVPYVIPSADAHKLALAWFEAIDAFPPRRWIDSMHAFGLAVVKLGLRITLTHTLDQNQQPDDRVTGDIIHYCYGDDNWNKRHYFTEEQARRVWEPTITAPKETILGEILSQIREARDFYRDLYL